MRVDVSEAIALYADGLMLPIEPACQHWPLVRRGIRPMSLHDTKPYIAWNVGPVTCSQVDRLPVQLAPRKRNVHWDAGCSLGATSTEASELHQDRQNR